MIIYLGADHRGFKLKEYLKTVLQEGGYEFIDLGNDHFDQNDDYPDFAIKVARRVSLDPERGRGILICGSGAGIDIVANKFPNIRSVLGFSPDQVYDSRRDNDSNVLSLPSDFLDKEKAKKIVLTWLITDFSGEERHRRRLNKIYQLENAICRPIEDLEI